MQEIIEETTTRILPVLISAVYTAHDGYTGRLALQPNADPVMCITIIHDSHKGTASYELRGNSSPLDIPVRDYDVLVILARYDGEIAASAVLQVEFRLIEQIDALLNPLVISNVIIEQHKAEPAEKTPTTEEIAAILADVNGLIEVAQ